MLFPFCILLASVAHLHGAASSLRSITYSYNTKSYFSLQHLLLVEKRYSTLYMWSSKLLNSIHGDESTTNINAKYPF